MSEIDNIVTRLEVLASFAALSTIVGVILLAFFGFWGILAVDAICNSCAILFMSKVHQKLYFSLCGMCHSFCLKRWVKNQKGKEVKEASASDLATTSTNPTKQETIAYLSHPTS